MTGLGGRLRHCRRRFGRLCVLANRLSEDPGTKVILIEAGGARLEPLDPHPGRLLQDDERPRRGLVLPDQAGPGPERPSHQVAARQGPGRLEFPERAALRPRPARGLRPLAPDGQRRLGMGRRRAAVPPLRGPAGRRGRASRRRRSAGGLRHAAEARDLRCLGRGRRRRRIPLQPGLQRQDAGRRRLFPVHLPQGTPVQHRHRLPEARAAAPQPQGADPGAGQARRHRGRPGKRRRVRPRRPGRDDRRPPRGRPQRGRGSDRPRF